MPKYSQIAVDVPLRTSFTYEIPKELEDSLKRGDRVLVPFGKRKLVGVCLLVGGAVAGDFDPNKIKTVLQKVESSEEDRLVLPDSYLRWLEKAAEYYQAPIGQVIKQALPEALLDLKRVEKEKTLKAKELNFSVGYKGKDVELTSDQEILYQDIANHSDRFYPYLLHGVTGSGKTEIYIKLIKDQLALGRSSLFLLPEIGLTPQMLARLHHHFKGRLLVYHSSLTVNQRSIQWTRCLSKDPFVMVGTRSALFSPLHDLGLIIVDEEHDTSYKQDDRFRYHARDLAMLRGQHLKIPVVLGSATPSLESYHLAREGKYKYGVLTSRVGKSVLPEIRVVDFAKEKEQTGSHQVVSETIHQAIEQFTAKGKQVLLFVGQRGFAQNAFCTACKSVQLCPNCAVSLTYHKPGNHLKCHYCDYDVVFDEVCFGCKEKALTLLGYGTQTVEQEVIERHPKVKVTRIDSDIAPTAKKVHETLEEFYQGKTQVLIGTQMITKGHDFPNVSFVGVLGLDAALGLPDFRSGERSFQTLVQVAGRAGRAGQKGYVIVQSYMPDASSIVYGVKQDYEGFANEELSLREMLLYPPYSRLVQIRFLATKISTLNELEKRLHPIMNRLLEKYPADQFMALGPVDMPLAKVRGKYRRHLILKIRRGLSVNPLVDYLLGHLDSFKIAGLQIQLDRDPMNLL